MLHKGKYEAKRRIAKHRMLKAWLHSWLLIASALLVAGCPKGNPELLAGAHAEAVEDYDTALVHYERALRADPTNPQYKLKRDHVRFEAGQLHVEQGQKALESSDLDLALAEFRRAQAIDPSNVAADQGSASTLNLLAAAKSPVASEPNPQPSDNQDLLSGPPRLKPLSREPINLKMTNDSRVVFDTVAKLAGLTALFDPDFTSRRIAVELPNVTLEQALDAIAFESKAFWKPLTASVILVAPDQAQKRRDFEEEVVQTFYLSNTLTPQDLTEIVNSLRQLLDLRRVQQLSSQNAIVIRDTPDKMEIAEKVIRDIDQAKPEVLLHVSVLQANLDRLRDLGILPGQSATLTFTPANNSGSNCGTSSASASCTQLTLNNLRHLSAADYSITLPGATANALLTDSTTRIIQDPEMRVTDGQKATLKIGDRVPVATGSFQSGIGAGSTGGINPLVNTQFQYIDVGVNVDVTPRIHPDHEISLKIKIEVSSVTGTADIGGISQPIISQRTVEHDIRLKDGEVNMLGGLLQRTETKTLSGWPGLARLPLFRYFFSEDKKEIQDNEVLIVLTPHIIRLPSITAENLRRLATGTDTNVRVFHEEESPISASGSTSVSPPAVTGSAPTLPTPASELHFNPATVNLKVGDRSTIAVAISDVQDLFSIPLLVQYNPAVVQIEEVRNGGFLSGGTQEIAIIQRVDAQKGEVIISATRQPGSSGVSGSGTLFGLVIHGVAPGTSEIQILQVNARDSQQKSISLVTHEASIQVQ